MFLENGIQIVSGTPQFNGYGRVHVACSGKGASPTWIYWNRTDHHGNQVILNASGQDAPLNSGWISVLLDAPDRSKFPYFYQCVVENKCCPAVRSSTLKITYHPTPESKKFLSTVIAPQVPR